MVFGGGGAAGGAGSGSDTKYLFLINYLVSNIRPQLQFLDATLLVCLQVWVITTYGIDPLQYELRPSYYINQSVKAEAHH